MVAITSAFVITNYGSPRQKVRSGLLNSSSVWDGNWISQAPELEGGLANFLVNFAYELNIVKLYALAEGVTIDTSNTIPIEASLGVFIQSLGTITFWHTPTPFRLVEQFPIE